MVNKRGFAPNDDIDPDLFDYLMVYDTYIEPSGTKMDMLFHSYKCYTAVLNNPNITNDLRQKLKVTDFDFLDILDSQNLSTKERHEKHEKEKQEKQSNDIKSLGEQIKKMAGKNNGK